MTKREDSSSIGSLTEADIEFLSRTPFFEVVPDEAQEHLVAAMTSMHVPAGQRLITQGEQGEDFHVIRSGRCVVNLQKHGLSHLIGRLGPGDIVGEMAILTGEKRSADVTAETDMTLWTMSRESFDRICAEFPQLGEFLTKIVANRLSHALLTADRTIGKYLIEKAIGDGGGSVVYRGLHTSLNMPVAIKMLKHHMAMDTTFAAGFRNEAKIIAQLNHHNIVKVYDVEEVYRTFFIIMEYVEGESLRELLQRPTRPPLPILLDFLLQICSGLLHAHQKGVVHRDMKPGNILIHRENEVKIVDFGMACSPGTKDTQVVGTVYYISPEQIKSNPVDERSDIYSLGILAYEMLTGRKPYPHTGVVEILSWHLKDGIQDPRTLVPDMPAEICTFLARATQKDPALRYQCIEQVVHALMPLADRFGIGPRTGICEQINMMSLFLFYRSQNQTIIERLVREFRRELEKTGVRLRGAHFKDVQEQ
ncbi:MAG: protein kinase [Thermodesulfobacteriota bacterium]